MSFAELKKTEGGKYFNIKALKLITQHPQYYFLASRNFLKLIKTVCLYQLKLSSCKI